MKHKCIALLAAVIMVFSFFTLPVSAEKTQTDQTSADTQTSADSSADGTAAEKKGGLMALTFD
ncbi:MAG: hypothetical protein ACI4QO_07865, partial [Clostridia bacterium]